MMASRFLKVLFVCAAGVGALFGMNVFVHSAATWLARVELRVEAGLGRARRGRGRLALVLQHRAVRVQALVAPLLGARGASLELRNQRGLARRGDVPQLRLCTRRKVLRR